MKSFPKRMAMTFGATTLALATAVAFARQAPQPAQDSRAVIGSHQIDRFEAIRLLQRSLKAKPDAVGDWVILGELAHEAALDVPTEQDDDYYRLSREAYEKALALDPENAGLKAAVQFARDQEQGAEEFNQARKRAARTYVEARRREMSLTNNAPTVRVYANPQPQPAAADPNQPQVAAQPQPYPYQTYQPFVPAPSQRQGQVQDPNQVQVQGQGRPYTYQQYQSSQLPPNAVNNPQAQPMTLRQLGQQLPGALLQDVTRGNRPR